MKRILCISFSPLNTDARVLRQLQILSEYGEVTTIGYGEPPNGSMHHLRLPDSAKSLPQTVRGVLKLALRLHRKIELSAPAELSALRLLQHSAPFDLVVANDARALPLAFSAAGSAPVWADLHEWAKDENSTSLPWRLLVSPYMDALCRRYLSRLSAVTTVNQSIAELYAERYGVRPGVVRNAVPYQDLAPSPTLPGKVRLVHSGVAIPERNIEALIEAVRELDERFTLDLYLMGDDDGYLGHLKTKAQTVSRVRINPPVSPTELPRTLNAYDLGVYLLPLRTLNHQLMLPNKFFDFVQARLGLLISPAKETSALIEQFGLGPALYDHSATCLVAALTALTPERIREYKQNAHLAAAELSSVTDQETMRDTLSALL